MNHSLKTCCIALCCFLIGAATLGCGDADEEGEEQSLNQYEQPQNDDEDDQCLAPAGTYERELIDAGGDCPGQFVDEIAGSEDVDIETEQQRECGTHEESEEGRVTTDEMECVFEAQFVGEATEEGMENAAVTVEADCDDTECQHEFDVHIERK